MCSYCYKIIACAVALQLVWPAGVFADERTVVIVPVHDGISDDISDDLIAPFSKAVAERGLTVISQDKVEAVLSYYKPSQDNKDKILAAAQDLISRAKEHYYNFDHGTAASEILKAISLMEKADELSVYGEALRDAYLTAAVIERAGGNNKNALPGYFKKVLGIDPQYVLDVHNFQPSLVEIFNEEKTLLLNKPHGELEVETDPKVAEVYINGIFKGVTPYQLAGQPEGNFQITIKANKYRMIEETVKVAAGEKAKVRKKLAWVQNKDGREIYATLNSADEARAEIAEGKRVADLIRVPKVVLIDADRLDNGTGHITARMIDRGLAAGHNPIIVGLSKDAKDLAGDLSSASDLLVKQYHADITNNPKKHIDPDGIGSPVLLGGRDRRGLASPAAWVVLGGVLAAAVGGTTAALTSSGGGTSNNGSLNVQFK